MPIVSYGWARGHAFTNPLGGNDIGCGVCGLRWRGGQVAPLITCPGVPLVRIRAEWGVKFG